LAEFLHTNSNNIRQLTDKRFRWGNIVYEIRSGKEVGGKTQIQASHFISFYFQKTHYYVREISQQVLKKEANDQLARLSKELGTKNDLVTRFGR